MPTLECSPSPCVAEDGGPDGGGGLLVLALEELTLDLLSDAAGALPPAAAPVDPPVPGLFPDEDSEFPIISKGKKKLADLNLLIS
jgi:hypothetical protein